MKSIESLALRVRHTTMCAVCGEGRSERGHTVFRTSKIEESWFRAGLTFLGSKRADGFLWLRKESGFGWVEFLGK